jgi:hypothetical protein
MVAQLQGIIIRAGAVHTQGLGKCNLVQDSRVVGNIYGVGLI